MRNCRMTDVEHARQICVDDLFPLVGRHVGHVGEDADARIVDDNVEATETRDGSGNGPFDVCVGPDVGLQRFDLAGSRPLDFRTRRRKMRSALAGDCDLCAFSDQRPRNCQTDPARSLPSRVELRPSKPRK